MSTSSVDSSSAPARCPVCGAFNQCRMETGEAFKGPCWCEKVALPASALRRLADEIPDCRCLCPRCLEAIAANPEVTWEELRRRGEETGSGRDRE